MSIWGGIVRMFTLPKNRNSLSDILGHDAADAITATVNSLVQEAAASALKSLAGNIEHGSDKIGVEVTHAVTGALKGVSPVLADTVNAAVGEAIGNAKAVALDDVEKLTAKVVDQVSGALKLK